MKYERPSKKAIGCMYVASGIADVIVGAIVILLLKFAIPDSWEWAKVIGYIALILCALDLIIIPYIRYCRYQYCITDECIDIKEGFFFIERNIVPIERLHKIQTIRGPIDRMFGLSKVIVTTAGGAVTIRFLEDEVADQIAMNLQHRINQIIVEQRDSQTRED